MMAELPYWSPSEEERRGLVLGGNAAGPTEWCCGVDLGQSHDPTAVAVVERHEVALGRDPATLGIWRRPEFRVRHLERLPLGTMYPEVAREVADLAVRLETAGRVTLVLDATGVGKPVVDLVAEEVKRRKAKLRLVAAVITGGEGGGDAAGRDSRVTVPKRMLVTGLMIGLESGRVRKLDVAR